MFKIDFRYFLESNDRVKVVDRVVTSYKLKFLLSCNFDDSLAIPLR